jgi:hypothetical protein
MLNNHGIFLLAKNIVIKGIVRKPAGKEDIFNFFPGDNRIALEGGWLY